MLLDITYFVSVLSFILIVVLYLLFFYKKNLLVIICATVSLSFVST